MFYLCVTLELYLQFKCVVITVSFDYKRLLMFWIIHSEMLKISLISHKPLKQKVFAL